MGTSRMVAAFGLVFFLMVNQNVEAENWDILIKRRLFLGLMPPKMAALLSYENMTTEELHLQWTAARHTSVTERLVRLGNLVTEIQATPSISEDCARDLKSLDTGYANNEEWALEMYDSWGSILEPGVFRGNVRYFGEFDQCHAVRGNVSSTDLRTNVTKQRFITGKYCMTIDAMFLKGYCFPQTCHEDDLAPVLLDNQSTLACNPERPDFSTDAAAITATVVLSLFTVLIMAGTALDIITSWNMPETTAWRQVESSAAPTVTEHDVQQMSVQTVNDISGLSKPQKKTKDLENIRKRNVTRIFLAFSFYTNVQKLLAVKHSPGSMPCLHGIRVLSICWVILGHLYQTDIFRIKNLLDMLDWSGTFAALAVTNATVAVDTFFLLSGLLTCFLFMKELHKRKGNISVKFMFTYYVHRYIRLTPLYGMLILVHVGLWNYVTFGPFWTPDPPHVTACKHKWWKNLLYINNFISKQEHQANELCMAETWYLANDMQMYIIAPLFLIPLFKLPILGAVICVCLMVVHILSQAILRHQITIEKDVSIHEFIDIYTKPWCRIGVYVMGAGLGYILYKTNMTVKMNKVVAAVGWLVGVFLCGVALYGKYKGHEWTPQLDVAYSVLFRPTWALGVSWIIFACVTGYGGLIDSILSWKFWLPLSRLNYAAYMVHMRVLHYSLITGRTTEYFRTYDMVLTFLGHLVFIFVLSAIFSLTVESPLLQVEKVLRGRGEPENAKKRPDNAAQLNRRNASVTSQL